MNANAAQAAQLYTSVARQLNNKGQNDEAVPVEGFGSMVKNAIDSTIEGGQEVDKKVSGIASGRADIVDLVTAVAETEVAVETMVTVRDRVISAYQEILNMPI